MRLIIMDIRRDYKHILMEEKIRGNDLSQPIIKSIEEVTSTAVMSPYSYRNLPQQSQENVHMTTYEVYNNKPKSHRQKYFDYRLQEQPSIENLLATQRETYNPRRDFNINPECPFPQAPLKMQHIDDFNKSVKVIMKCNQQYRGELLSAYQNKSKIQLQNVILIKENQNLEEEKLALIGELEEQRKKAVIMENYKQRQREHHKKICEQMKQEIQGLQEELKRYESVKFDIGNLQNEKKLLQQKMENDQSILEGMRQQIVNLSEEFTREKYLVEDLRNRKILFVQQHSKHLSRDLQQQRQQKIELTNKIKLIEKKYEDIRASSFIKQQQIQGLLQVLKEREGENVVLKAESSQLSQVRSFSQILRDAMQQKQRELEQQRNKCGQFKEKLQSLTINHQHQIKELIANSQREQSERERLSLALLRKEEQISYKQKELSNRISQILQYQEKLTEKQALIDQRQSQIKEATAKIDQLEDCINQKEVLISEFELALKQIKTQHFDHLKKSVKNMADQEGKIQQLQKQLTSTHETREQEISRLVLEMQEKEENWKKIFISKEQEIVSLQQIISKANKLNNDLKGQIEALEQQNENMDKNIKELAQQKAKVVHNRQKLAKIYDKCFKQLEELKIKIQLLQFKRLNAKNEYESQINQLTSQLNYYRSDYQKLKITSDTIQLVYKQIHSLQEIQRTLSIDPKISISRFTTHVNATHRQAFTRQAEKTKQHISLCFHLAQQIKSHIDILKLNINTLNRGFEITFAEKKPQSPNKNYL